MEWLLLVVVLVIVAGFVIWPARPGDELTADTAAGEASDDAPGR